MGNDNKQKQKNNKNVLFDIFEFLKKRKAWWLAPIVVMFLIVGLLIIVSRESVISPFIYSIF